MEKSEKVHDIFERISPFYDKANDRISLGMQKRWKRVLITNLSSKLKKTDKILDVCCGTGDIAISLAKNDELDVVGLDFSESMLKVAKEKTKNYSNISFIKADAKNIPYPDNTFKASTISFGLRNTDDYTKVIAEMVRVSKKDAYIYILDSFPVKNKIIKPFYIFFFKYLMPFLGGGFKNFRDYNWLYESTKNFIDPSEIYKIYQKLGLRNIEIKKMMFGACVLIMGEK